VVVEASAAADGLLLLSQIWDPGWSATVDGQAVPIHQANYIFSAIPISAGEHTIELRYTPPLLWPGLAITLGSVAALCLGIDYLVRRERRENQLIRNPGDDVVIEHRATQSVPLLPARRERGSGGEGA
jgi:uncharacterized membrane protein YfhO